MTWDEVRCRPNQIRCRVAEHVVGNKNRRGTNKVFMKLRLLKAPSPTHDKIVHTFAGERKEGAETLADDRVCRGIGDLIVLLDARRYGHVVTIDVRDWSAFKGCIDVQIHIFPSNPDKPNPSPF